MAEYDNVIARTPSDNRLARQLIEQILPGIVDDVEQQSVALQLGNVYRMSSFQTRIVVANTKPHVNWINGTTAAGDAPYGSSNNDDTNQVAKDSALKQTTSQNWANITMTPDEIAILVPMPDAWRADSNLAWSEVTKSLKTAAAQAIDDAIFWGTTAVGLLPSTFGDGVIPDTIAAGAITVEGGGVDLADDYAAFFQDLEERGMSGTNAVVGNSETWRLRRLRSSGPEALPIYQDLDAAGSGLIYGRGLREVSNGTWRKTHATALAGEFSNLHIGIRQEPEFKMFDQGIITDADGNIVFNSMQNDGEVLRMTMRLGYVVTDPYRHLTGQREWPFQVLAPMNYSS